MGQGHGTSPQPQGGPRPCSSQTQWDRDQSQNQTRGESPSSPQEALTLPGARLPGSRLALQRGRQGRQSSFLLEDRAARACRAENPCTWRWARPRRCPTEAPKAQRAPTQATRQKALAGREGMWLSHSHDLLGSTDPGPGSLVVSALPTQRTVGPETPHRKGPALPRNHSSPLWGWREQSWHQGMAVQGSSGVQGASDQGEGPRLAATWSTDGPEDRRRPRPRVRDHVGTLEEPPGLETQWGARATQGSPS